MTALENNPNLKELRLSYIELYGELMDIMINSLAKINSITSLQFLSCKIENDSLIKFSEKLISNKNYLNLNLSRNNFNGIGLKSLFENILILDSIETLNLTYFSCNEESIELLSDFLSYTNRLKELIFNNNFMLYSGLKILLKRLNENNSLKSLHLMDNGIDFTCIPDLVDILKTNKSLQSINLALNRIYSCNLKSFEDLFKYNPNIINVDLSCTSIDIYDFFKLDEEVRQKIIF